MGKGGGECAYCGAVIENPRPQQIRCDECARAYSKKPGKEKGTAAKRRSLIPDAAPLGWSLRGKSGDRVTCEARALGLSYGEYTAACNFGTIERMLADRGIANGKSLVKKAWEERKRNGRCEFVKRHTARK